MAQKGLSHIALKARDLKKTEDFYTSVLGLKVAFRHPPNMLFLTTPGSDDLLNFVRSAARVSGSQGLEHIGFKVTAAGLKQLEKSLKERGVKIEGRRAKTQSIFSTPTVIKSNTTATETRPGWCKNAKAVPQRCARRR